MMSKAKEVYDWFDGMGYDTRAVSLVRVAQDAWSESKKRATAAERERCLAIISKYKYGPWLPSLLREITGDAIGESQGKANDVLCCVCGGTGDGVGDTDCPSCLGTGKDTDDDL